MTTTCDASSTTELNVLSYNVHGLFGLAAKDSPRDRMPTIGWLANQYDVALLQEDFEYPDVIRDQMQRATPYRGSGLGAHPVLWLTKILVFPANLLIPRFSAPYGSGLTTFLPKGAGVEDSVVRKPYADCAGWFSSHGDCWARKGYLRVRMRAENGAVVDFYNTHIEAGTSSRSMQSRRRNFEALTRAVEQWSADAAVVVAGDFNVDYSRPRDRDSITLFRKKLGLSDSGAGPRLAVWRERDFILLRDGAGAKITVVEAGEATEFVSGSRALSDHPAIYARLRLRPPECPSACEHQCDDAKKPRDGQGQE